MKRIASARKKEIRTALLRWYDAHRRDLPWRRDRDAYRVAFAGFDPERVARFGAPQTRRLMSDEGIVRNRTKISSAVDNAKAFLEVAREFGTFDRYVWRFVGGAPKVNRPRTLADIPATSAESDALSKDLRARGFSFVGSTIIYAHLQATGLVDDHLVSCFRKAELASLRAKR